MDFYAGYSQARRGSCLQTDWSKNNSWKSWITLQVFLKQEEEAAKLALRLASISDNLQPKLDGYVFATATAIVNT